MNGSVATRVESDDSPLDLPVFRPVVTQATSPAVEPRPSGAATDVFEYQLASALLAPLTPWADAMTTVSPRADSWKCSTEFGRAKYTQPEGWCLGLKPSDVGLGSAGKAMFFCLVSSAATALSVREEDTTAQDRLTDDLKSIMEAAAEEIFEDGMESKFSLEFTELVSSAGSSALDAFVAARQTETVKDEVVAQAIRVVGRRADDLGLREEALDTAEALLRDESSVVRDGAIIALAHLAGARAASILQAAAEEEPLGYLKDDMLAVLSQIRQ